MEDRKPTARSAPESYGTKPGEKPRESVPTIVRQSRVAAADSHPEDVSRPFRQAGVTAEERRQLIARAAYFRAERRGFTPGSEIEDWLAAEAEVDRMHSRGSIKRPA